MRVIMKELRIRWRAGHWGGCLALAIAMLALGADGAWAALVEDKRIGVKVYSEATNKSDVIGSVEKGTVLEAGERQGMYWEVQFKGSKAFVSVLKVKRKAGEASGLAKAIRTVVKEGRPSDDTAEVRARSAVMGVRGLKAGGSRSAGDVRPDLRAVYAMEDISVPEKRVEALGERVFNEVAAKAKRQ